MDPLQNVSSWIILILFVFLKEELSSQISNLVHSFPHTDKRK